MANHLLDRIASGRTDLVFGFVAAGNAATSVAGDGTPLIKWCAYYGDVSAIRFLLANGESPQSLGDNLDLNGAAFHGHWRLCEFLVEQGADVNKPLPDTGETPLHRAAAFGTEETIQLLLDARADISATDMHGASPLSWGSWHARPDSVLRLLCYGEFSIRPGRRSMAASLLGEPRR